MLVSPYRKPLKDSVDHDPYNVFITKIEFVSLLSARCDTEFTIPRSENVYRLKTSNNPSDAPFMLINYQYNPKYGVICCSVLVDSMYCYGIMFYGSFVMLSAVNEIVPTRRGIAAELARMFNT